MSQTNLSTDQNSVALSKRLVQLFLLVLGVVGIYYVVRYAFPRLIPTEENYGEYYYARVGWVFIHVFTGIVAIILGPFQFMRSIRSKRMPLHRTMGKVYLVAILISGTCGIYLSLTSRVNLAYAMGLFFLSVSWLVSAYLAYISVRRKNIEQHKEWMLRSYTVTLAFVTFRVFEDILHSMDLWERWEILTLMSWACWAVPLLIIEVYIQGKKI